jgi:exodeoxyribonuclease VII small subunit
MKELTYEQAMEQLETITAKLEDGSLPLQDALQYYEKASGLIRFCSAQLDAAEQKITELATGGEHDHDA